MTPDARVPGRLHRRPGTGAPRRPRRAAVLIAVVSAAAGLAGCGGAPHGRAAPAPVTTTTVPSGPAAAELTGAAMTIALPSAPTNWNPLASANAPSAGAPSPDPVLQAVSDAVLPSAYTVGSGMVPSINRQLLTSAAVTGEDPQTVTYRINPGATWSDGTRVTAADFVYTWQADSGNPRYRDVGNAPFTPASTAGYDDVASVRATPADPLEVVVTFTAPDADWRALFSPLLPAQVGRRVGFDHGFTDPVADLPSAGPFVVASYDPGWDVVLVRNPAWWGAGVELSSITIDFVPVPAVAGQSLLAGQLDAASLAFTPGAARTLRRTAGLTVSTSGPGVYDDLVLDERGGMLAATDLRKAILLAVDRSALAEIASTEGDPGEAPVDNRAFLPGEVGYTADEADLGRGGLTVARALLASAGYRHVGSSLETRTGQPVVVTLAVATSSAFASLEATAVVSACRSLGVRVIEEPGPEAPTGAVLPRTGWDMAIVAEAVSPFSSSFANRYATNDAANVTGYSNPAMDALVSQVDTFPDGPARTAAVHQVDALAWADAVDLPLLFQPALFVVQSRYVGIGPAAGPDGPAWDVARWGVPAGGT